MPKWRSFAKINLYLDVLPKREDGFHDIETIFQSVGLWDELRVELAAEGIALTCSDARLPVDDGNLAYRAAALLRDCAGVSAGVSMHLEKGIPAAAGLAGGSGNAAAALVACKELWELDWPKARLMELAAELGSDVPFCLMGGTAAATGRGEVLHALPGAEGVAFVLLHPEIESSTASVYGDARLVKNDATRTSGSVGGKPPAPFVPEAAITPAFRNALDAYAQGDWDGVVFNAMEGPLFGDYPALADWRERLLEAGCVAAAMSGSGPTLFGVCRDVSEAERVAAGFGEVRTSVVEACAVGVARLG